MTEMTSFIDKVLYPQVFEKIDIIFPEFQFRKSNFNWISSNKLRLNGIEGQNLGSVCVYQDRPYFIQDYSSGGKAITTYLQERGQASSWFDAIQYLANKVGVDVPHKRLSEEDLKELNELELKTKLYEATNDFFIESLSWKESKIASTDKDAETHRRYLETRGYVHFIRYPGEDFNLRPNRMELGFVQSQEAIRDYLKKEGFAFDEIERLLMKQVSKEGEFKPLPMSIGSTHKLSIPIRDHIGRILGFAFRNIAWNKESKVGKYLYSSGLKRNFHLFNLKAINGDRDLIIVEGLLDALYAKALGLSNVVALGGTSLNETQVKAIKDSGVTKITLCLDRDQAGEAATAKAIKTIQKSRQYLKVYIASLPQGFKDPDELIRLKGIEAFKEVIEKSKADYTYLFDKRFSLIDESQLKITELHHKDRDLLLKDLVEIGSQVEGSFDKNLFNQAFLERVAPLGISQKTIEDEIDQFKDSREKKRQRDEILKELAKTTGVIQSDNIEEAKKLLGNIGNNLNTMLLENTINTLLQPLKEEEVKEKFRQKPNHIDSGFRFGEDMLSIPAGAITILAAPTSHGKTSFLINLALNMALDVRNKPIYFFSYEEDREAILLKVLNTYIDKPLSKNNRRSIESYFKTESDDYITKECKADFFRSKDIFFSELVDTGRLSIHYVESSAEELIRSIQYLHRKAHVGAILIDYMQLLRLKENRTNSRQEELKQICLDLKSCAVDTGFPIILGAQFNRTVTEIGALHSSAIGEAGDIERIANLIIGFWNKQFQESGKPPSTQSDEIYATILKGRDISLGKPELFNFNGNTGKITNNFQSRTMHETRFELIRG